MTREQLEEAKVIEEELHLINDLISDVHAAQDIFLYWSDRDRGRRVDVPRKYIDMVKEAYEKDLYEEMQKLQERFDAL